MLQSYVGGFFSFWCSVYGVIGGLCLSLTQSHVVLHRLDDTDNEVVDDKHSDVA